MPDDQVDFDRVWAALPRKRVAAGVIFLDWGGRVLLVNPTYKSMWEVPGGMVEVGESPRCAAVREVREELGVGVELGPVLVCDWSAPGHRPDDGIMFLYRGGQIDDSAIRLAADELSEWRWCTKQDVQELLHPATARRVIAAMNADQEGIFTELEDGYAVFQRGFGSAT